MTISKKNLEELAKLIASKISIERNPELDDIQLGLEKQKLRLNYQKKLQEQVSKYLEIINNLRTEKNENTKEIGHLNSIISQLKTQNQNLERLLTQKSSSSQNEILNLKDLIYNLSSTPKIKRKKSFIQNFLEHKNSKSINYSIDKSILYSNNFFSLEGWAIHPSVIILMKLKGQISEYIIPYGYKRSDVHELYSDIPNSENSGFLAKHIQLDEPISNYILEFHTLDKRCFRLNLNDINHELVNEQIELQKPIHDKAELSSNALSSELKVYSNKNPKLFIPYKEHSPFQFNTKLITFYLPQFHQIPENDIWWGKGFTEWTNVTSSYPKFKGHFQPRLPSDLGFYDLSSLDTIRKQVELAINYGIHGFCFHYYWFSGRRLLEKPLDLFLNSDIDFNFCICWANENWTKTWDGLDNEVLIKQDFDKEDPSKFIKDLLPYLKDKRYIKLGNQHLIIVYRPQLIPNISNVVEEWRKALKKEGIDPLFACAQGFGLFDPNEVGFDLAIEFPPHKFAINLPVKNQDKELLDDSFTGYIHDYADIVESAINYGLSHNYPLIRGVFPSWDNDARRKGKGSTIYSNQSPELYSKWLSAAIDYAKKEPVNNESVVFINAWNEWAEGAYLEPDRHYGYNYLETTYNTLKDVEYTKDKIIIVSHDAHKHGAQINALHKVKTFKEQFGYEVVVFLLEGGDLEIDFRDLTTTYNLSSEDINATELFKKLYARGFHKVIANTTVSGKIVKSLHEVGYEIVSLIHELPKLIKSYKLQGAVKDIAECAHKIVFASEVVKNGFNSFLKNPPKSKEIVNPQGVYSIDLDNLDDVPSGGIYNFLNLDRDSIIVSGIGFGDHRKGFDLFVETAQKVFSNNQKFHFVWIGDIHQDFKNDYQELKEKHSVKNNIHVIPFQKDVLKFINDIDVFLLTSREDPFPTVVLESMALGAYCIVFENSGGIPDLNNYGDLVELVEMENIDQMSDSVLNYIKRKDIRKQIERGVELMKNEFRYDKYCFDLSSYFTDRPKSISVVVPNYNYENHLEERLMSIWNQTYPVLEVIVLDDKSSDNSVKLIKKLAKKYNKSIRLFLNSQNSGSVFKQWKKGIDMARGELIWIAEADDSADPRFLEKLVEPFQDQNIGMAYCQSKQIDEKNNWLADNYHYYTDEINKSKWKTSYKKSGPKEIIEGLSVRNTILNVSSIVFRTQVIKDIIRDNIEYVINNFKVAGDWYLYIKLLERNDIYYLNESLNIHRRHSKSTTSKNDHSNEVSKIHNYILSSFEISSELKNLMEVEINR